MRKFTLEAIFLLITGFAISLVLVGCNSVPTRRVHAAASVPRYVDVTPENFTQVKVAPLEGNAGYAHGIAFSDAGNVHDATILHGGITLRFENFAGGFLPYHGSAHIQHEGTGALGALIWGAYHFGGGNEWRFSYQNSYGGSEKVIEDKGCENDQGTFFYTNCTGSPESASRAEVRVRDLGFILTAEKRLHGSASLLLAPSVYWTQISSSNRLDSSPGGNYAYKTDFWSPGFQIGYTYRFGDAAGTLVSVMAGAHSVKYFRPDKADRTWMPSGNLRVQF